MDEAQKQGRLDDKPLREDDVVSVGKPGHEVEKNAGNGRRGSEGHIREWHLDDLLSFEPSLESTIDGSSPKVEGLEDNPDSARLQSAETRFSSKMDFALIILNQAIDLEIEVFMNLFFHSQLVICADGGANHLYDYNSKTGHEFIPSVVAGDFDSLKDNVRLEFEKAGTQFHQDHDQDTSDFDKSMHIISEYEMQHDVALGVLALGGLGGRVDQSFSSIHQLYKCSPKRDLFLLSQKSLTCLLPTGANKIYASKATFGPTCGIVPTSGPTTITLQGFKWDLKDFITEFGGLVSTSNEILENSATVISDKPVVWTVEIREAQKKPATMRPKEPLRIFKKVDLTVLQ